MDQTIKGTTAVILAAGYGSRISGMTDLPKSLLTLGGKSILQRNLEILKELEVRDVVLVLGFKSELIEAHVEELFKNSMNITYVYNHDYINYGNTYSLKVGIDKVQTESCLIFDADLVYEKVILKDFLIEDHGSSILVGDGELSDIECAKALSDSDGFVRLTVDKRSVSAEELKKYKFVGEAIGILRFQGTCLQELKKRTTHFLVRDENRLKNWEHLLNEFLVDNNVGFHHLTEGLWVEIDTPADYESAKDLFGK